MNYLLILLATLSFNAALSADRIFQSEKILNDTGIEKLRAGFYVAIPDTSNAAGYKLHNKNEYYFLGKGPAVAMNEVDAVYIELNLQISRFTLIFNLDSIGTKKWFDFTTQNNGMQVALVLEGEIYHISTIASPIDSGSTVMANAKTKNELEGLKTLMEQEMKKAKEIAR